MNDSPATKTARRNWLALLPLFLFLGLAGIFLTQLMSGRDTQTLPSALIGQPVPLTNLPPIEALASIPGITPADFKGKVTVLNVFASWCAPCRDEHPVLLTLANDRRFQLIAINYKDKPENAAAFLGELGNPYARIGADVSGRAGIDWGVYGVPETYVIGPDGIIRHKHVGPLDAKAVEREIMPEVTKAAGPTP
jgi:cytochrome c biogenesis protein CcmG, thiol:disulfide interchange protein DsbE